MFDLFGKNLDYSTGVVLAVNHDLNSMSQEEIIDLLSDTLIKIVNKDPYLATLRVLGYDPDDYEYDDEEGVTRAYEVYKIFRDFIPTDVSRKIMRYIVRNVCIKHGYDLRDGFYRSHASRYSVYKFFEVFRAMYDIKKEGSHEANC